MRVRLIILLSGLWLTGFSQVVSINLSSKHQQKLNGFKSGHKRMAKYYKFYKKDSTRHVRLSAKKARKEWDSITRADVLNASSLKYLSGIKNKEKFIDSLQGLYKVNRAILTNESLPESEKQKAVSQLKILSKNKDAYNIANNGSHFLKEADEAKAFNNELKKWWAVWKDTTNSDSVRQMAKEKVKSIALTQANQNPHFRGMMQQYSTNGQVPDWNALGKQVPGFDSLQSVFNTTTEELFAKAETLATESISKAANLQSINAKTAQLDLYKNQLSQFKNANATISNAKEKAKEEAANQLPAKANLPGAQMVMSKLLSKYSSFSNASDLSDAVKRTSLKGKTFKERLVVGGNFNIISKQPWSFDITPSLGYRINTKFYFGLGVNYRFTFGDSLKYKKYVSSSNSSTRVFASYDLFKNFYAYSEVERSILKNSTQESRSHTYQYNFFIAVGQKLLILPKLYMTITALYNLNAKTNNASYPNRFTIRMGFQSSDLAFRKKKIYYDRNRN